MEIPIILECSDCGAGKIAGRNAADKSEFEVYPNPATSMLIIKTAFSYSKQSYSIYSATGNLVMKGALIDGENRLDISEISNGLYILNLTNGEYKENKKIVILH